MCSKSGVCGWKLLAGAAERGVSRPHNSAAGTLQRGIHEGSAVTPPRNPKTPAGCARAQAPYATVAAKLQEIGLERGWGDTVGSTLDTMHLLGELLQVRFVT